MRDRGSMHEPGNPDAEAMHGSSRALRTMAILGAVALIATPALASWRRRRKHPQPESLSEPAIDKSLEDTYPASDPPAPRYFDIPENRR